MNQAGAEGCAVLTRQVQPMQQCIRWMMVRPLNRAQAVALHQQGQDIQHCAALTAQCFKESARVRTESLLAGRAIQTSFNITVNFDIPSIHFAKITTCALRAPLLFEFHSASPLHTIIAAVMLTDQMQIAFTA